jgi:hypothetical protein
MSVLYYVNLEQLYLKDMLAFVVYLKLIINKENNKNIFLIFNNFFLVFFNVMMMTNKYSLLFKKIDDNVITLTRNTLYKKIFTSLNVKLKLKTVLVLFSKLNSL